MNKCMRVLWSVIAIVIVIALTLGVILPPIISSNVFPAWAIVVCCGGILGALASVSLVLLHFARK